MITIINLLIKKVDSGEDSDSGEVSDDDNSVVFTTVIITINNTTNIYYQCYDQ